MFDSDRLRDMQAVDPAQGKFSALSHVAELDVGGRRSGPDNQIGGVPDAVARQ